MKGFMMKLTYSSSKNRKYNIILKSSFENILTWGRAMRVYFIVTQMVYFLTILPWFLIWGLSLTTFGSGINLDNTLFVLTITVYPVVIVVCSIIAWYFHSKKPIASFFINFIPIIWMFLYYYLMTMNM
ncbi:hypothetical protein D7X33_42600 [Butyricicoccus sp. 1XD8-22]|nr:hypothetical protein D7X33_42600 [Butyricicoccus sp. 1XD8-22]